RRVPRQGARARRRRCRGGGRARAGRAARRARRRHHGRRRDRGAPAGARGAMSPERAVARVDRGAIRANAGVLARAAAPAELMAVVKADGYGHGATAAALAALEGGARRLAVATVAESEALRS